MSRGFQMASRRKFLQLAALAGAAATSPNTFVERAAAEDGPALSLAGKKIAVSATGTDHYWDLKAYQAQLDEVKRLGGEPIGLDAGRNDSKLVAQLQNLIAQK